MGTKSHSDSREHIGEHMQPRRAGNIALSCGKHKGGDVMVHPGMVRQVDGRTVIGGHAATLFDGATVPAGKGTAAVPGWGNGSVRSGNPMAHAPASKRLQPVQTHPNHRSRINGDGLGAAVMDNVLMRRGGR
jgi:hypothetical protein